MFGKMQKQIFKIFLLFVMFFMLPNFANAAVVWETDFEDVADWSAPRISNGFPNTWTGNPSRTLDPPKKMNGQWLHPSSWVRTSPSTLAVSQGPMATIGAGQGRESSRGLTYNFESGKGNPTYSTGWAGGSPLTMYFGEAGYPELWVEMWVKYPSDMDWWDGSDINYSGITKAFYIARFNGELTVSTSLADDHSVETRPTHPAWLPHMGSFYSSRPYFMQYYNRSQTSNGTPEVYDETVDAWYNNSSYYPYQNILLNNRYTYALPSSNPTVDTIRMDGQWHKYTYHVKMNSAPGVADGIQEVSLDDVRMFRKTNMAFILDGGSVENGWNYIELMDNHHVASHMYTENVSYPVQIDDVVISTNYIGPDYIVGGVDMIAPAAPTGLGVE
ncbi:TPA: hypothetical protein DDZ49_03565 [Candidatus Wolfebacteria bacterium]|uniref:Uncharacterized protein n=1 Tax=Candidatus Wolfebacteria bacterium GW2011_GWB1_47_1 TaxID=1619007 RepID=A0A0G4AQQ3_9BACT|nr:MAG: hypothetical protein UX70_C0001G0301 [Candidatus Wolfebacteria bacterium GW2011_GWB1_47_1]KKU41060.1 MAG: hypothetical protein UX58_C0011G0001 [Candidatus Wolfebacteria bacterium GW2011_GWB2_46_69]KKU53272.1 MAG: hypothetical protein UX76_C0019G0031 [Candidatus Wolfebacteria bacterium GW2011_GWC1_47_103]KKU65682.1 MAG: hypothetical protein UX90_C0002G0058 [Candidatus Wolfebacteria bacterium GW2011_GWD2_47_17]HBD18161.1 hypothetical protein [Candidatus Wolfebacteria bacterium]